MPLEDPVNRPQRGQRVDAQLAELPLDGERPLLSVLGLRQSLAERTDQVLHRLRGLRRHSAGRARTTLRPGGLAGLIALEPQIEPAPRSPLGATDGTGGLPSEIATDGIDTFLLGIDHGLALLSEGIVAHEPVLPMSCHNRGINVLPMSV